MAGDLFKQDTVTDGHEQPAPIADPASVALQTKILLQRWVIV